MARRAAAALAALAFLAGCDAQPPTVVTSAAPAVCRVGPDDGPAADWIADKGIGGTGAPLLADKGIGGTGIVAVISGFASICLAGQEVALPADAPIRLGAEPGRADQLRAGQVAVIDAGDTGSGLAARRVSIRFEVSGPVERVEPDRLSVAGQRVAMTARTLGVRPARGDWVAVSGIRRADGTIEATRVQVRAPGPVVVHGVLRRDDAAFRVGTLALAPAPSLDALVGRNVTATGTLLVDELVTESVAVDLLATDPGAYFGPATGVVLIEGYGELGGGRLRLGQGFAAPLAGSVSAGGQRGIYRFERGVAGLRAVGGASGRAGPAAFGPASPGGSGTGSRFSPAQVPHRGDLGGAGAFQRFGPGDGAVFGPGGSGRPGGPDQLGPGRPGLAGAGPAGAPHAR